MVKRSSRRWTPAELATVLPAGVSLFTGPGPAPLDRSAAIRPPTQPEVKRETRSKFGNIPTVDPVTGRRFASKLEARYAQQLELERKAGAVLWWVPQASFLLEGGVVYRADFLVVRPLSPCNLGCTLGRSVDVVDCKGFMTSVSFNKMRQLQDRYGIVVQCWNGTGLKPYYDVPHGLTRRKRTQPQRSHCKTYR